MSLVLTPRSTRLAPYVSAVAYYAGELPPGRERVLPTGTTEMMINLVEDEFRTYHGAGGDVTHRSPGAILRGPAGRFGVIDTAEQRAVISVSFRLGGAAALLPLPPSAAADELIGLDELWGRAGAVLRERVLAAATVPEKLRAVETALVEQLPTPAPAQPAVTVAAVELERGRPVTEVADRLGWLPNRLTRTFRDRVGLTPKRFARVRRLQRVVAAAAVAEAPDWAELAVRQGYYDQAHLINDFRELAGITPTAYRPRTPAECNHVPL
jgi:AraC-like DNA-binding protein